MLNCPYLSSVWRIHGVIFYANTLIWTAQLAQHDWANAVLLLMELAIYPARGLQTYSFLHIKFDVTFLPA